MLEKGLPITDFDGWDRLEDHERALGSAVGRERVKLISRGDMTEVARVLLHENA